LAEVPLPYAKNLERLALPNEDRPVAAALAALGVAPGRPDSHVRTYEVS